MTAGWVFKLVQAGIVGLMVFIIIKVFADRFRKQSEERTGKPRKPLMEEIKGKIEKRKESIHRDADYVELDGKVDVSDSRVSSFSNDDIPPKKSI